MKKFNWQEYLECRPDLKKNWNGSIRARIHWVLFRKKENENDIYFFKKIFFKIKINQILKKASRRKDDVSIIIGIKDKPKDYLENAFKSIRNQDYPRELIKIILIDYSSKNNNSIKYQELCKKYNSKYIFVKNKNIWNRAHCLNIGIRRSKTKYTLTSDVDIIFEKNYISEAIKELRINPLQVIICEVLYSNKDTINTRLDIVNDFNLIKKNCILGSNFYLTTKFIYGQGINITLTNFYKLIRGYDEKYLLWGCEDEDIIKRFNLIRIKTRLMSCKTSLIHQWHKKYFNLDKKHKEFEKQVQRNRKYFRSNNSINRNSKEWGKL